jgi:hypothetical protein
VQTELQCVGARPFCASCRQSQVVRTRVASPDRSTLTRFQSRAWRCEGPCVGDRPRDMLKGKVVEGREDQVGPNRPEWRGTSGEVAHPETLVPSVREGGQRLHREVRHDVNRLDQCPQAACEEVRPSHQNSLTAAGGTSREHERSEKRPRVWEKSCSLTGSTRNPYSRRTRALCR